MPIKIVELFESGDPVDEERKEHRRLVLEEALADPDSFIEKHEISLLSSGEGESVRVRVPLKKEYRFVYGDPTEESSGEGVLSSDRPQMGDADSGGEGDETKGSGESSNENNGAGSGGDGEEDSKETRGDSGGERESEQDAEAEENEQETEQGEPEKEPLKRGEDISQFLKDLMEKLRELFGKTGGEGKNKDGEFEKKGQKGGEGGFSGREKGPGAGNQRGEILFETDVVIDDLSRTLSDKYELPDLENMNLGFLSAKVINKPSGFRRKGPLSQVLGGKSAEERLKRLRGEGVCEKTADELLEDAPWHPRDLRFRRKKEEREFVTNAVVDFVRDASGSIDTVKLRMIRAISNHVLRAIRKGHREGLVLVRFFTFETAATELEEVLFFYRMSGGGTKISAGIQKVLDESKGKINFDDYNHYVFFFTDGENQSDDLENVEVLFSELCSVCRFVGYFEILRSLGQKAGTDEFYALEKRFDNISICVIQKEEDMKSAFGHFLERGRELDRKRGNYAAA